MLLEKKKNLGWILDELRELIIFFSQSSLFNIASNIGCASLLCEQLQQIELSPNRICFFWDIKIWVAGVDK